MKKIILLALALVSGCVTPTGEPSACATCGLGGQEREQEQAKKDRQEIWHAEEVVAERANAKALEEVRQKVRDALAQAQVAENQQAWARYFVSNMANAEFEALPNDSNVSVSLSFSFHNNTDYPIDDLTFQLGDEVWVDDLGTQYPDIEEIRTPGCRPTKNCYSSTLPNRYRNSYYLDKTKFCSKMNGNIWLTHVQGVKLDNPVNLMPQKASFCEVTQ